MATFFNNHIYFRLFIFLISVVTLNSCVKKTETIIPALKEIVIADINSSNLSTTEYIAHYQMGIQMALNEINSKGGVNNIKLKVEYYDDYGNYGEAYRAGRLAARNAGVIALMGTFFTQTAKGVSSAALAEQIPFLANGVTTQSIIHGDNSNYWTFRLKPSIDLEIEALSSVIEQEKQIKSFSILTYTNEEGQYISDKIKSSILLRRPDAKFLNNISVSQFHTYGEKLADDTYNSYSQGLIIAIDGYDVQKLVLLLEKYKSTINKRVYILYAGEPEWLESLGNFTPNYWISTGFPWYNISNQDNIKFYKKYQSLYKRTPRYSSYLGYSSVYLMAQAITDAGITNSTPQSKKKLAQALKKASINGPLGKIAMQEDNQSNLGVYVGILKPYNKITKSGKNTNKKLDVRMFDSVYVPFKEGSNKK